MTVLTERLKKQIRSLPRRLSPGAHAGLHLTIGVLIVLICGWCFGAIAEDVSENDPMVQIDKHISVWFNRHALPAITLGMRATSFFGSVAWVAAVSAGLALFFVRRRDWLNSSLVAITLLGGSTLSLLLKHLFHRARPVLENPLVTLSSYGFPSGHTMGATTLYGLLALLAWKIFKQRTALACTLGACLMILLIGFSRIYLGAHYLSDVIGALAAGLLWLAFCWTAMETLRRRRKSSPA